MANKKLFTAMLAIVLVLAMTAVGCGKGSKTDSKTAESGGGSVTESEATASKTGGETTAKSEGSTTGGTSGGVRSSGGWTAIDVSSIFGSDQLASITTIAFGNGKFVAVGGITGSTKMAYSTDGVKWTAVDVNVNSIFSDYGINAIAFGNGKFVAGSRWGKMATSTDGVTWTAVTNNPFPDSDTIYTIAFGNGTFVAGGSNGRMATSTDGITWTEVDMEWILKHPHASAFGNDTFVAVDSNNIAYSSDNGATWTRVTNNPFAGIATEISEIAFGNGTFVIGTGYGYMAYSSDNGVNWTRVAESAIRRDKIYAIAYGKDKFVAGGYESKMATSTDGVTWTAINIGNIFEYVYSYNGSTFDAKGNINAIAYGNGMFVAGAGGSARVAYFKD